MESKRSSYPINEISSTLWCARLSIIAFGPSINVSPFVDLYLDDMASFARCFTNGFVVEVSVVILGGGGSSFLMVLEKERRFVALFDIAGKVDDEEVRVTFSD